MSLVFSCSTYWYNSPYLFCAYIGKNSINGSMCWSHHLLAVGFFVIAWAVFLDRLWPICYCGWFCWCCICLLYLLIFFFNHLPFLLLLLLLLLMQVISLFFKYKYNALMFCSSLSSRSLLLTLFLYINKLGGIWYWTHV